MRYNPHRPTLPDAAPIRLDRPYTLDELPTPALVIDVDAMQRNLVAMIEFLGHNGVQARPHSKTHKCPIIAHRQIGTGAIGICCAKVSEAEVMFHSGIESILITSPVASEDKVQRVVDLCRLSGGSVAVVVDSQAGASLLSEMARRDNVTVPVLLDVDPGTHRTGVALGEPAVELARQAHDLRGLALWGIQAYAGHLMHKHGYTERKQRCLEIWQEVTDTRRTIEQLGIGLPILTGAGTGTFDVACTVSGITDLQVGSYLFMDREYREIGGPDEAEIFDPFESSLFVLTTAISQPTRKMITVDAGIKSLASDSVKPELMDLPDLPYHFYGDEHGVVVFRQGDDGTYQQTIEIGQKLRLRPPHCDPTVNLYDHYFALQGGRVQELWPIACRGRSQ
jgi:D-serine deaminase-like pyridoxal phosphate-dependent protein